MCKLGLMAGIVFTEWLVADKKFSHIVPPAFRLKGAPIRAAYGRRSTVKANFTIAN
jgi:hypothetical protein